MQGDTNMNRTPRAVTLCVIAIVIGSVSTARPQAPEPQSALTSANATTGLATLPPAPRGRSTTLGGEIKTVDPVRDEITLRIFGQRPLKILFDERTQVFRDGNRIPLRELAPSGHASVESLLDGTDVYARSIHLLSQSPDGEDSGRVTEFNPGSHELTITSTRFGQQIKMLVPNDTPVTRVGQSMFTQLHPGAADLVTGALISIKFQPDSKNRPVAKEISVLASPGATFVFTGSLSALDMHSGVLLLLDPRNGSSYQLSFDSLNLPTTHGLHLGDHVIVTARYDGTNYVTSTITLDN